MIFGYNNEVGTVTILSGAQGRFVYEDGNVTSLFLSSEFQTAIQNSFDAVQANSYIDQDFVVLDNVNAEAVIQQIEMYIH